MKTKEEILKPFYKQNKGGLEEWVDHQDVLLAMDQYANLKKREMFAAMFVQGMATMDKYPEVIVKKAVKMADLLIQELNIQEDE